MNQAQQLRKILRNFAPARCTLAVLDINPYRYVTTTKPVITVVITTVQTRFKPHLRIVMANLKEQEKWEDGVYQIEENDPVLGGENGITNKPIKQLANRTLWLKKTLELFGKKSAPKDLTAESTSTADESGHSHKLPVGSTTEKGIWQGTSDTGIDSDGLVLTAKAGKKLAQLIAQLQLNVTQNYINNNKKSDSVIVTRLKTLLQAKQ